MPTHKQNIALYKVASWCTLSLELSYLMKRTDDGDRSKDDALCHYYPFIAASPLAQMYGIKSKCKL